jgi:hypothetical protein
LSDPEIPGPVPERSDLRRYVPVIIQLLGVAVMAAGFGLLALWAGLVAGGVGLVAFGTAAELGVLERR